MSLPLLLDVSELATMQAAQSLPSNVIIVDLSRRAVYQQAHVPGAVFVDFARLQLGAQPAPGKIPAPAEVSALLSEIGFTNDSHVIAYDDEGGGWAGRFIWMLDMIGHDKYSYLDGGIHAWLAEGLPTQSEEQQPEPSGFSLSEFVGAATANIEKQELIKSLEEHSVAVWDARSYEEYTGARAFAQRAGHMPGAKHFEWTQAMDRERSLRVVDLERLQAHLDSLGLGKDKNIVTHCQSHHRSGFTYLLGKILAYPNIRAYDGSWSEWGNSDETPIVVGEE